MTFITLFMGSDMLKIAEINFWQPSLSGFDLTYLQIAILQEEVEWWSPEWGYFLEITWFSGAKLTLQKAHFYRKILVSLPYLAGTFFGQGLWTITEFGVAIAETCQGVTRDFILPETYMTTNKGVWNSKTIFASFYCSLSVSVSLSLSLCLSVSLSLSLCLSVSLSLCLSVSLSLSVSLCLSLPPSLSLSRTLQVHTSFSHSVLSRH